MSVRACVRALTYLKLNISETSWLISNTFYLMQHRGGEKILLRFGADRIRPLVSMATYSSHRVLMGENGVSTFSRFLAHLSRQAHKVSL